MAERPMQERVLRALKESPARSQLELGRRVLGDTYTVDDWDNFTSALRWHMAYPAMVIEERAQVPGTGHEGPPVYEYTYRLATAEEKTRYEG